MAFSLKTGLGGGSVPIGGVTQLAVQLASPLVEIEGKVYLQSGYVLRGESQNYPDATAVLNPNYSSRSAVSNSAAGNAYSCAYGAGRFVVVGQTAGVSLVSTDGATWEARSTGMAAFSSGGQLTFGAGKFVANNGYYSADGLTWTAGGAPLTYLRYLNDRFISYYGNGIKVSDDGVAWPAATLIGITGMIRAAFGNGKYVIAGGAGKVAVSTDGEAWQVITTPATADFVSVEFGAGFFVAATATDIYRSADGITWSLVSANAGATIRTIIFADGAFFVATRGTGDFVLVSKDGLNWLKPSAMVTTRLGVDGCFANDQKTLVFAAETTSINVIHTDQMGLPIPSCFGATVPSQTTVNDGLLDFVRLK